MEFIKEIIMKYPRIVFVLVVLLGMKVIRASFKVILNVVAVTLFIMYGIPFLTEIFPILSPLNGVVKEVVQIIQNLVR